MYVYMYICTVGCVRFAKIPSPAKRLITLLRLFATPCACTYGVRANRFNNNKL